MAEAQVHEEVVQVTVDYLPATHPFHQAFASGLGFSSVVHLEFGPFGATQALYYSTFAGGGQVRRIAFQPAAMSIPGVTTGLFSGF